MTKARAALGLVAALALTSSHCRRHDPADDDAARVVAAFERVMAQPPEGRAEAIRALRTVEVRATDAVAARDACVRLFESMARADSLQREVAGFAHTLGRRADAGMDVAPEERAAVLLVYGEAGAAADAAQAALPICTRAVDDLRLHRLRRH